MQKTKDLQQLGIQLEVMWGCQFRRLLPSIQTTSTPCLDGILYSKQSETELLDAIKNDRVFGLLVADLKCPDVLIKKFHNFPPFVKRMKLQKEHLTDFMKEKIQVERGDEHFKQETLVQVYNAKEYLILSSVAKEYLDWGIEIKNVKWFMQYEKAEILKPFAERVTEMRIQAEKDGDATKSTTAKIFGNSGYGKVRLISIEIFLNNL